MNDEHAAASETRPVEHEAHAPASAPTAGRGDAALRFLHARAKLSAANLATTWEIVQRRYARRPPVRRRASWIPVVFECLLLAIAAAFLLDAAAGAYFPRADSTLVASARLATDIGLSGWYLVPAALLLLAMNQLEWDRLTLGRLRLAYNWASLGLLVLIAVGLSGIVVNVFKYGLGRARPHLFEELGAYSFHPLSFDAAFASFPSGHSTTMGAVAGLVALLYPKTRVVVIPLALFLAMTRIFVGAHFPSDVIAGFALGLAFALVTATAFARLGFIFRLDDTGAIRRKRSFRLAPFGRRFARRL